MRTVSPCTGRVNSISPNPFVDSPADNGSEADEAYVIGKRGQFTPVGAYLASDEIVKIAVEHGAQMIHPGRYIFNC